MEDRINEYGGQIFLYVKIVMKEGKKNEKSWRRYRIRENNKQDPLFIREMKVSQGLIKLRIESKDLKFENY